MLDDATANAIVQILAYLAPILAAVLAKFHIDKVDLKRRINETNIALQLASQAAIGELDGAPVNASDVQRIHANIQAAISKVNGH